MDLIAEPVSRIQLRRLATLIRQKAGHGDTLYFPVMELLERKMPLWFRGFNFEIKPKSYFPPNIHAETDIEHKVISIREDVYLGAINGNGRDRMTIIHEIAHYILLIGNGIKLYRNFSGAKPEPFRDPEWQAKALAGEILCPYHLIRGMATPQIGYACGVSEDAARYHFGLRNPTIRGYR
jgi:Zn-dependent peptidase ImmA (M78 family)